ncbi:MAG: hypothetical protein ACM3IL_00310, partial [Deltaproteobacteria bacterium]
MNKKVLIVAWAIGINLICLSAGLAQSDIEVNGIFYDEKGQSYAIVNGNVAKVGNVVNGAKVTEINKDFVRFENKTGVFEKRIGDTNIKQQLGKILKKNWISDSFQSVVKKVKEAFGVKEKENKVAPITLINVLSKEELEQAKKAEQEGPAKIEAVRQEQIKKAEQERLAKLEQERLARLEQERLAKIEAARQEQIKKAEQERLARLEQAKKAEQ